MKKIATLFSLALSMAAFSQEADSLSNDTSQLQVEQDSLAYRPRTPWGVYGELGIGFVPTTEGYSRENRNAIGIAYKKWSVGFQSSFFDGAIERRLIFPNSFRIDYAHGGSFIRYEIHQSKVLNGAIRASYEKGDMVWERLDTGKDFLRDEFDLFTIGVELELGYLRYLQPYVYLGYQQMVGLNLSNVQNGDFIGFFFFIGLRFGYFNQ